MGESGSTSSSSAFDQWYPLELRPEIFSIFLVLVILAGIIIYYYIKIRKLEPKQAPSGFALVIFNTINYFKDLAADVLGPKFVKWTPYFLFLFTYILACNLIGIFGFENPTASTTVTFSLGIVTVVGTFVVGVRFQKQSYFLKYVFKFYIKSKNNPNKKYVVPYFINPLGFMDNITPLLSISLRLWGNIFAGALILTLFYSIPQALAGLNPLENDGTPWLIIMGLFAAPFHAFFDLLVGLIQAFVFTMLTMSYWGNEMEEEAELIESSFQENAAYLVKGKNDISVVLNSVEKV